MSRISVRSWSKGSARGAGPVRQVATVRVKSADEVQPHLDLLRGRRMCRKDGKQERRCDDCGAWVCDAPGHMAHRCGLEPENCPNCWTSFYVGPSEPPHLCEASP